MNGRSLLIISALASAAAAAAIVWYWSREALLPVQSVPEAGPPSVGQHPAPALAQAERGAVLDDPAAVLRVLAAGTGTPLAEAKLVHVTDRWPRILDSSLPVIASTDTAGLIHLPAIRPAGGLLVVRRAGYCAAAVDLPRSGMHTIELQPGSTFTLRCCGRDGGPLAGCTAILSPQPIAYPAVHGIEGEGMPGVAAPVWTARSGTDGVARLAGLRAGKYFVAVSHGMGCPRDPAALSEVTVPDEAERTIVLTPISAIAVMAPSGDPIAWHRWEVDLPSLVRNPCVNSLASATKLALQQRFPGTVVFVAMSADPDGILPIRFEGGMADGAFGSLEGALLPLPQVTGPVVFEIKGRKEVVPMRVIVTCAGHEQEGIPLLIFAKGGSARQRIASGDTVPLAHGSYGVSTYFQSPGLQEFFAAVTLTVDASVREREVRIAIPVDIACLEVRPALPQEPYDVPIHVTIESDAGYSVTRPNWLPDKEPIRFWLPVGDYRVRASASGYRLARQEVKLETSVEPRVLPMMLARRGGS